jgi:hypothetical protein
MESLVKKNEWVCQRGPENNEYSVANRHRASGFRVDSMKDVQRINYKWMHKAALQCRSACAIFGTSKRGTDGRQEEPESN